MNSPPDEPEKRLESERAEIRKRAAEKVKELRRELKMVVIEVEDMRIQAEGLKNAEEFDKLNRLELDITNKDEWQKALIERIYYYEKRWVPERDMHVGTRVRRSTITTEDQRQTILESLQAEKNQMVMRVIWLHGELSLMEIEEEYILMPTLKGEIAFLRQKKDKIQKSMYNYKRKVLAPQK